MFKPARIALCLALCLGGCVTDGGLPEPDPDPQPDPTPDPDPDPDPAPTGPLVLAGSYQSEGEWDLSDAIAADSLGDIVAALLIDEAVSRLPVPGFLETSVRDKLTALAADPISSFVDSHTPAVLDPDSGLVTALVEVLSQVGVSSLLELEAVPSSSTLAVGTETLTAITLRSGSQTVQVPLSSVLPLAGADALAADVSGQVIDRDRLIFAEQAYALRTDLLVSLGLSGLLSIPDINTFAASAIDCTAIVAAFAPGGITITVSGQSFTVSASTLVSACGAIRARALEELLGLTRTEIGVVTEGPAVMIDADADLIVDAIESDGTIGRISSLPVSLQAPFDIVFVAARQ